MTTETVKVELPTPHPRQSEFVFAKEKRVIVRAGRRGGKTVGVAIRAVNRFLQGRRQLYAAPTSEQVGKFWYEITRALDGAIRQGFLKKNESEMFIEKPGTEQRIKAKTAWNADTLRGDYADDLYLDEWQLMNEDTWEVVGAPMLLDNDGDAMFIYTPPSLRNTGVSKARDPRHAAKMFKVASEDGGGRWLAIHFTSHENPHISRKALEEITQDMSKQSYRQEVLAEDDELMGKQLVYGAFNERTCIIDPIVLPDTWPRYVGHDFGGANPAALFFAQDPGTGYFYAYQEYLPGAGYSTAEHVNEFKRLICLPGEYGKENPKTYNVIKRVGGSHQEDEIRQGYSAHGWHILESKLTKVSAQVDKVIGLMELNKVFTFRDLWQWQDELFTCLWDIDDNGRLTDKIKDEQKYHLCACARYILSDFTPETASSDKPVSKHSSFRF